MCKGIEFLVRLLQNKKRMERQKIDTIHLKRANTFEAEFDAKMILDIATILTQCSSQLKTLIAIKLGKDKK